LQEVRDVSTAATQDPTTFGRARLSFANEAEIDDFVATLRKFESGELTPDQWKAYRLVRGTYSQRQGTDVAMVRAKIPQGILSADQLRALADVADAHSRGFAHFTTRQNMQFHFVPLSEVEGAMRTLAAAGLTTREACGNSVRNITACPYAGVAADEVFDVTPYAEATTRYLLRHALSSSLPRKFKIAFEGCPEDHVFTPMNDLGFRAKVVGGKRFFRVMVAGGTATVCTSGQLLFEQLPAGEILQVAEAVVRVFHTYGDRQHRQRNRLKFLLKEMGWDGFKERFDAALAAVRADGASPLDFDAENPPQEVAPPLGGEAPSVDEAAVRAAAGAVRGPGLIPRLHSERAVTLGQYARWQRSNVRTQKQPGYSVVTTRLLLGDITSSQLRLLADLASAYGDGCVRATLTQNLALRWVPRGAVSSLYRRLAAAGLGEPDAETPADVTSCPGAESCRLAVTQSRGLAQLLGDHLKTHPEWLEAAADLRMKISGCPNGCGQHHVAGIGFQGSIRRVGSRAVPQYFVMVGGGMRGESLQFGRLVAKIPARRLPQALDRLFELYFAERAAGETATAFFQRAELAQLKSVLSPLEPLTEADADAEDFVDLGEQHEFHPEIQEGECAA
jgi:sulfite reductase beta subunit-like hemoprotein